MYQVPLKIASTIVGPDRLLSVPGFFRVFQDAAVEDVERIGYEAAKTMGMGLLWVFSRVHVRFHELPAYLSEVTLETHPGPKKAFLFPRYASLKDAQGRKLVEASSIWALIHEDTRKLEMRPALGDADDTDGSEMPLPEKVVARPASYRFHKTITYADLDLNGHMNNVRYVETIMDLHDAAFYQKYMVSELLIQYESEIREGDNLEVFVDEENSYVRGVVGDRIAFEANIKYRLK